MSIQVSLLIKGKSIAKPEIDSIVTSLGYDFYDDNNEYFWFDKDYVSTRGCFFYYYSEDRNTILQTVTYAGRSHYDYQKQIDTIKEFENIFGGEVTTDGAEGYEENDFPIFSKTEIACGFAHNNYTKNIFMAKQLIEEIDVKRVERMKNDGLLFMDKNLMRNNTLLPFLVSIMENFLRTFVYSYLETNEEATDKVYAKKESLHYSKVKEIVEGRKKIIDFEIDEYSFQNFRSANKAFKEYLGIDLFNDILNKRYQINNGEEKKLISTLQELIDTRHNIIHEAAIDFYLDKKKLEEYLYSLEILGEEFVRYYEEKGMYINLEEVL